MSPFFIRPTAAAIVVLCAALAQAQTPASDQEPQVQPGEPASVTVPAPAAAPAPAPVAEVNSTEPRAHMIRGNNQVIAKPSNDGVITGPNVGFKFEDAPITEVAHVVLRDIARVDYILHPPITGNVTLATRGDIPADQAVLLLESALQANGLVMARDTRGVYHVGKPEVVRGIVPAVRQASGGPLPPGYGAIVVPLKYIGAGEMSAILRPLVPPEAMVRVDPVRNLLVMVGTRTQAEGWLDIVRTFDVDMLKGMSVGVFPLKHVTTKEIDTAMRLLNASSGAGGSTSAAPAGNAPGAAATAAATASAAGTQTSGALSSSFPLFGALRILPVDRINSMLVVSPRAEYLDEARQWIEKLDQPSNNSTDAQLFVYPVQNGSAKHLAAVLNGLFGNGSTTSSTSNSGVAPALQQASSSTVGFAGASQAAAAANATQGASNAQGTGVTSVTLNTGVRVIADEINNAVLVYATRPEFEKIEATLKRLDVPPTQVLIEATIVEVTLSDGLEYGLQWVFNDKRGSNNGTGVLSTVAKGVLGDAAAGFSYTLRNSAGDVRAVLNALAEKSLVKVISSPSLMVLDNHTANIAVGNQQPIRTGETVTTGGNVSTSIQYKDTGVSLSVTPSVNAGNTVTMQINQAVTDVGAIDDATKQRAFLNRQITSKVAVRSGESVVLGGLIRDNTTNGNSGVPFLKDIPVLGALFSSNNVATARTELLVIITPRVVRNDIELKDVGAELQQRMKSIKPLLLNK